MSTACPIYTQCHINKAINVSAQHLNAEMPLSTVCCLHNVLAEVQELMWPSVLGIKIIVFCHRDVTHKQWTDSQDMT